MPKEYPRTNRLNAQVMRELAGLIRDELTDPRVAQVSVTRVSISPDLHNASVAVSVLGDDIRLRAAIKALNGGASAKLRHALGRRMQLRYVPALHFIADTQIREADRVGALIRDATARDSAVRAERGDEE